MSALTLLKPLDAITGLAGKAAETVLDSIGLPEIVGDLAKVGIGWHTGNVDLLVDGVEDAATNVLTFLSPKDLAEDLELGDVEPTAPPERHQSAVTEQSGSAAGQGSTASQQGEPSGAGAAGSGKDAARAFLAQHSDPEAFLAAVRNGLPPEVEGSQSAMLAVQQRMQEIQRMFQLMTQMLQAMHEMQISIVRNIRA